ncbi:MAG: amino acid adenylation domain-containing protein, partial [Acidobacteriaceae bacterium]|nr:amino acid adenylation domain-containing protein [Acidobacteriaceae bacterium]
MTEEQRREILAFSTNSCRLPAVSTAQAMLHRAFESRAAEEPGRTALVYQSASMTYGELNRTANAVAHALLDRGARLGTVIAGRLERSPDLIIFLLGVLKAGAICLPLDPWYPIERTRRILADARPEIVISHGGLLADIPGIDIAALKLGNAANPGCVVEDDQPSFLLYTSGSTGRPKGVLITYGGRGRRQLWTQRRYNADESDRHLLKSPVGFGTLLRETFWPLTTGGTIVIANAGGQADVSYLARLIVHEGITIANFVPSLLREFLDHPDATACTTLKHVVCTGEALPMDLQKRFQSRLPAARLHLFYGSTELPTATYHDFAETESERFITIGRPAGVPVYVLNEQLDLAPVGEPGEIFVGGPDLALGYYGHPEMTAERFIPDRFANSPGARLFRTGDRARWHADGRLEYLGRADEQVKIRGCRVELGEVREAIRAFPGIRDVAVISAITGDSGTRIVAFYIPGEHAPSTRELRRHLAARLPTYMIPARLIQLDRFPLDAHGKLNRQKLGAIAVEHVTEREIGDPPLGALEEKLASIWCDAMDLDSVGRDEAFSDLGGDSISALRIVSDIRESLDFEIPVSTLFARATIRQVAEEIRSLERPVLNPPVMYEHLQGDSLWRLSSAQRRIWFLHVLNRENKAYNVAVAFQLAGDVDVNVLQDRLNSIVSRHEVLRSSVVMKDGEPYQRFIPECIATLSIIYGPKDQASDWLASFMARPLDLSTPPQLHASLFRTDEQHHILALLLPHFVCDRLSLRIIRCELFGEQRQFPSSRYSDFITQEQSWLNTPAALIALESWKRKFEDRPALVEIPGTVPISRAVAEGTLDAADSRSRPLRKDLLDGINSLSSRERCTPFAVFWTALA